MCVDCSTRLARDVDAAFPEFLAHHQDLVYGLALRMTKRPADAEDLAQETFIRAYRALQGYDAERRKTLRSRGWLASIVVNLGRNRARRSPPAAAALDIAPEPVAAEKARPDAIAERRDEARAWRARLDALPTRYARAVELRHVQGLSYPELAEALGRPLGTVKSDVHRGVRMLRQSLKDADLNEQRDEAVA